MKTLLIVEDNNEVRKEISEIFNMENFDVLEAENGLEGYIKATHNLPDIIISDIMMPVMNGYDMFKELQSNALTEQIPIIFLSALSANTDIRKGMNLGAEDYLIKPVNADDLLNAANNKIEKFSRFNKRFDQTKINITNILYHELNTPLNSIVGFSDYLRRKVDELSSDTIKKVANNIYSSSRRLTKLAEKYLIFSKLKISAVNRNEIKKMRDCEYISSESIITDLIKNEQFTDRKNDFILETEDAKIKIHGNMFKYLMIELIENAVKFSSGGQKIRIKSYSENNNFVFRIKNEGMGLSREKIMSLNDFEQFNTDTYAQNGSGLGLSIVKFIAEIYDLEIIFDSIVKNYFSVSIKFDKFMKLS